MKKLIISALVIAVLLAATCLCFADGETPILPQIDCYVSNPEGAQAECMDRCFLIPAGTKITVEGNARSAIDLSYGYTFGSETSPLEDGPYGWKVSYEDLSPFAPELEPGKDPSERYVSIIYKGDVDVYGGPDVNLYGKCGTIPEGSAVKAVCYDSDLWAYVEYGDLKGWAKLGPWSGSIWYDTKYYGYYEFHHYFEYREYDEMAGFYGLYGGVRIFGEDPGDFCPAVVTADETDIRNTGTGEIETVLHSGDEVAVFDEAVAMKNSAAEASAVMIIYGEEGEKKIGLAYPGDIRPKEAEVKGPGEDAVLSLWDFTRLDDLEGTYKIVIETEKIYLHSGPAYFYDKKAVLKKGDEAVLMNFAHYRASNWLYISAGGVRGWIPSEDVSSYSDLTQEQPHTATWSFPLSRTIGVTTGEWTEACSRPASTWHSSILPEKSVGTVEKLTFLGPLFEFVYARFDFESAWINPYDRGMEYEDGKYFSEFQDILIEQDPGEEVIPPPLQEEPEEPEMQKEPERSGQSEQPNEEPRGEPDAPTEEPAEEPAEEAAKPEAPEEKEPAQPEKQEKTMSLKTVLLLCALAAAVLSVTALVTIRLISDKKQDNKENIK